MSLTPATSVKFSSMDSRVKGKFSFLNLFKIESGCLTLDLIVEIGYV